MVLEGGGGLVPGYGRVVTIVGEKVDEGMWVASV